MKIFKRLLALCVLIVFSIQVSTIVFATTNDSNNDCANSIQTEIVQNVDVSEIENELQPMMASSCDQYGSTDWTSLEDAMNYYGTDFDYYSCDFGIYNYYYLFSDGTRMYFGVH